MTISVFIPTYNGEKYIAETLDSVLSQTYTDFEILCVDDGSLDTTTDIIRRYVAQDPRVRLLEKPHEGAVPYAWNFVFPHLSGEFTLYLSHDDLLAPEALERMVAVVETEAVERDADDDAEGVEPRVDAVIPSLVFFERDFRHPESKYLKRNRHNDMSGRKMVSGSKAFALMLDYSIPGFALWRTSVITEVGMPTESFNSDEGMQRIWAMHCSRVAFSSARFGYRQTVSMKGGLKPYHYASLLTQLRLFRAARLCRHISPSVLSEFQYQSFRQLLYFKAQHASHKVHYLDEDNAHIETIFQTVYPIFRQQLRCPFTFHGIIHRLAASSHFLFRIASRAFSQKLR